MKISDKFLAFLYDQKKLDKNQIEDILDIQNHEKPSIGTLGKELGYLTVLDVMEIIQIQISISNKKYFGEIAIELGKLSENQVDKLLKLQFVRLPSSKEIISTHEMFSDIDFENYYNTFKSKNNKT